MNRIAIAASALSLGGIAAAGYYVSPSSHSAEAVEPVLVEAPPEQVTPRLRDMRIMRFIRQFGGDRAEREFRSLGDTFLWETIHDDGNGTFTLKAKFLDDEALIITAITAPAGNGRTSVDVNVEIPDNRFITSEHLHPADRGTLAAMVEVVATEYVSSVLNRQKMANGKELEPRILEASGMNEDELKALGDRMETAFEASYKDPLLRLARSRGDRDRSAWDHELSNKHDAGGFKPERVKGERPPGW